MNTNKAYHAGYMARAEGRDTLWNPYDYLFHTSEHDAWRRGWIAHQDDNK